MTLLTMLANRRDSAAGMLRRIAIAFGFLLAAAPVADAMTFTWRDQRTEATRALAKSYGVSVSTISRLTA
jgi:hypothetical protein